MHLTKSGRSIILKRIYIVIMIFTVILGFPSCSKSSKDVEIGIQLSTYDREGYPYTDVTFIINIDNEEEKILIGSYIGEGFVLESFENRVFFYTESLLGCQVFYAGGGDNVFAYLEDGDLIVKHIEFILGNDEFDSYIIDERIIVKKEIPANSTIKIMSQDNE